MVVIYSKQNCPACTKTIELLKSNGIDFEIVKIDEDVDAKNYILSKGFRSVPQISYGKDLFVEGGYSGLASKTKEEIETILYGNP